MASGYHTLSPSHVEAKVVRVAHVLCMCFDAEFDCRKLRHNIFQHRVEPETQYLSHLDTCLGRC